MSVQESDRTIASLLSDYEEIITALAMPLAITSDSAFRAKLSSLAGGQGRFAVGPTGGGAWLVLDRAALSIVRDRPLYVDVIDLDRRLVADSRLKDEAITAVRRSRSVLRATELLRPLFLGNVIPSREHMTSLHAWSPLIEQLAYKYCTRATDFLDRIRAKLRNDLSNDSIAQDSIHNIYWSTAHTVAHLTLLSCDVSARSWLSEMARQFRWITWTPTFPLVRERTVWLAACAARAAIAFGTSVVDSYLGALSAAKAPMKAFDSLFGLTAIALGEPKSSNAILTEIRTLKRFLARKGLPFLPYHEQAYADALDVISGGEASKKALMIEASHMRWSPGSDLGLATPSACVTDPAALSASGHYIGFVLLPIICSTTLENHYPIEASLPGPWPAGHEVADVLRNTWVPDRPAVQLVMQ